MTLHLIRIVCFLLTTMVISGCATQAGTEGRQFNTQQAEPDKAAKLNMELGVAYMNKQDNEKALRKLQKALSIDPNYADAHNAIAILYARLREDQLAETHYSKAVKLAPNDSLALNNYGQFLCTHKQPEKAEQMFLRAVKNPLYRTPHFAYLNAGVCAESSGNLDKAEKYYREALKVDSRMSQALFRMANLNFIQQHYPIAQSYLNRYAEASNHSAESLWLAVQIERALGDRDAAASYALLLKNRFPDAQETRLLLKSERQ